MKEILAAGIPYILWVSLPLLPAILIFLIFPEAKITISGPLQGVSVKAQGAIGAYLVVFAVLGHPILQTGTEIMTNLHHHFWLVSGRINLFDGKGNILDAAKALKGKTVTATTNPPPYQVTQTRFLGSLVEDPAEKLPDISILIDGFDPITIDPNDQNVKTTRDDVHKMIVIESIALNQSGALPPNADLSSKIDKLNAKPTAENDAK